MFNKIIVVIVAIVIVLGVLLLAPKSQQHQDYDQKIILAKQIHNVMGRLMYDMRDAQEGSIQDVPADGQWHERVAFNKSQEGPIEYVLSNHHLDRINNQHREEIAQYIAFIHIRRPQQDPEILEIQIGAQKDIKYSLTSNFKIRVKN